MTNTLNVNDFQRFGDPATFALDVRLLADPDGDKHAPLSSVGSWGSWRLWVAGRNLCSLEIRTENGREAVEEVRWYLAPLFRWLAQNRSPLLHEVRLPDVSVVRTRTARSAYLSMLQRMGDDDRFEQWQNWARRHALRACAEGGILPDIFFFRVGDNMEISWGHRTAPGAEEVMFRTEGGVAQGIPVSKVAAVFKEAIDWFVLQSEVREKPWLDTLQQQIEENRTLHPETSLSWFLDSRKEAGGVLYEKFRAAFTDFQIWLEGLRASPSLCISPLIPEVAMFGALSPEISPEVVTELLHILVEARTGDEEDAKLADLVEEIPAWATDSPWDSGYELAREALEEIDPAPQSLQTDIEGIVQALGIRLIPAPLSVQGPRGVAIAGDSYTPTIVWNTEHIQNIQTSGQRFTIAHELCHILYDRDGARTVIHTTTPWAHPSVEQRANAFAAMLLMPPDRVQWNPPDPAAPFESLATLSETLGVGKTALVRHLANMGQLDEQERDAFLSELQ